MTAAVPDPGTEPARTLTVRTRGIELTTGERLNRHDIPDGSELHIEAGASRGTWTVHYFDNDEQAELRRAGLRLRSAAPRTMYPDGLSDVLGLTRGDL